jgi:hypothetical protein
MRIKSILISDDRVASGVLVNHVPTGLPQDESVRCADLWTVPPRRRYLCLGHGPQGRGYSVTSLYLHIQR